MLTRRKLVGTIAAGALVPGLARAQTPLSAQELFAGQGLYLPRYLELKAEAEGSPPAAQLLRQFAALVGDEPLALSGGGSRMPPPDLAGAEARDAIDSIVAAAREHQIVILNEAHNVSRHRAFAEQVLRALRPLGFEWIAAETFTPVGGLIWPSIREYRRGLPFMPAYGYYSRDPVYAEAVRVAAALGYRFADYEERDDQTAPAGADRASQIAAREQAQAENLVNNVLGRRPDARIFVLCGYGHLAEAPARDGSEWFALRLKRLTGIDPLTIEQALNWPAPEPEAEGAHVTAALDTFQPDQPITVSRGGRPITYEGEAAWADLSVYHPRLAEVSGRPGWLAALPERQVVEVDIPEVEGPALLQAMHAGEGPGAVPADQFPLQPGQRRGAFVLRPGRYHLRVETLEGLRVFGGIGVG